MKISITHRAIAALSLSLVILQIQSYAAGGVVSSPNKRLESLSLAKSLIDPKISAAVKSDPFHSAAYLEGLNTNSQMQPTGQMVPKVPTGPRTSSDLLQAISASLKPSGFFVIGGEPTLVFGEKRVKAGGILTISFEGVEYTLEITAIDRPNFTLRLNREEITRPIK